jgi:hypothetical protein
MRTTMVRLLYDSRPCKTLMMLGYQSSSRNMGTRQTCWWWTQRSQHRSRRHRATSVGAKPCSMR